MNYYVCSVGEPQHEPPYHEDNLVRCIWNKCFVYCEPLHIGPADQIRCGDVLILKYNHHFVGYGRALSRLLDDRDLGEGFRFRVDVDYWIIGTPVGIGGIQEAQIGGTNYDTVKLVREDFALEKMRVIGFPANFP